MKKLKGDESAKDPSKKDYNFNYDDVTFKVIKEEEVRGVEVLNVSTVLVTLNVSSKRMSIGSLLAELQRLSV